MAAPVIKRTQTQIIDELIGDKEYSKALSRIKTVIKRYVSQTYFLTSKRKSKPSKEFPVNHANALLDVRIKRPELKGIIDSKPLKRAIKWHSKLEALNDNKEIKQKKLRNMSLKGVSIISLLHLSYNKTKNYLRK